MPDREATLDTFRDRVEKLAEQFARHADRYRGPAYNEETARSEFISPFFEALGWDVANRQGHALQYRDVVHEEGVKVGDATKAPDYTFRIGGQRKFFVEAKKPGVDLKHDPAPAYQLRRYAWSAHLPLSIVTDFDELGVYDTRIKPREGEKASVARVFYFEHAEYAGRAEEIWNVFSKPAVLRGSFDAYAEDNKRKRGTSEVDGEFLKEIEGWREELARNIALRNEGLSVDELNYAVQATIDRILFLRIAEGRGAEDYARLQALTNGPAIYARLLRLFHQADERYNSGVFDFKSDKLTPGLAIDDKVLKPILSALYYPQSPYEFSVLPAEILGNVYEQFLGKVIRLTAGGRAKVEEKPEVKKAGGVYYTPSYIVDYIVAHTVGKLVEGKPPKEMAKLRIVDPACGSGSFLLAAYQKLLDAHLAWYREHEPRKHKEAVFEGPGGDWRLTTAKKREILLASIYGVDIDRQAVEVTKLSLLLKCLEGETNETLRQLNLYGERALPSLEKNIQCGNSLISPQALLAHTGGLFPDDEELRRINPFDWQKSFPEVFRAGGFDAVIGNPPYVRPHNLEPDIKQLLWASFPSFTAKSDLYATFIEKGLSLARERGRLSFIVPHTWTSLESFTRLRDIVLSGSVIEMLVQLPKKVFRRATVETCLFVALRESDLQQRTRHRISVRSLDARGVESAVREIEREQIMSAHLHNLQLYAAAETSSLFEKARNLARPLADHVEFVYGFKTADDEKFIFDRRVDSHCHPFIRSAGIRRYWHLAPSEFVRYVPEEMTQNKSTARPGERRRFDSEKLLVARMGRALAACYDPGGLFVKDAMMLLPIKDGPSLKWILGILNSKLLDYLYRTSFVTIDVLKNAILSLPIAVPRPGKRGDESLTRMNHLVEQMISRSSRLSNPRTPQASKAAARGVEALDAELDRLVYEIYELTAEEIAIVEKG